jgi:hypothetical protein
MCQPACGQRSTCAVGSACVSAGEGHLQKCCIATNIILVRPVPLSLKSCTVDKACSPCRDTHICCHCPAASSCLGQALDVFLAELVKQLASATQLTATTSSGNVHVPNPLDLVVISCAPKSAMIAACFEPCKAFVTLCCQGMHDTVLSACQGIEACLGCYRKVGHQTLRDQASGGCHHWSMFLL